MTRAARRHQGEEDMTITTETGAAWAARLYTGVDAMDAHAFASNFAAGGELHFGNADTVVGPEAIEAAIGGFFQMIKGIKHDVLEAWREDDAVFCDIRVTYTRLDGSTVTLPAAVLSRLDGDKIRDFRIFTDQAPLFA
jgi:SnoaL-like domain